MDEGFGEVMPVGGEEPRRNGGDRAVAAIAARQCGVVTTAQLQAAGLGRHAITHRVKEGRLHRLHRGVYLVGHALPVDLAHEQAALLACPGAILGHRSAGALWTMPVRPGPEVELTLVGGSRTHRPGIRVYRVPELHPRDVRRHKGFPVTAPARTLLDLATVISPQALEQATAEAIARRLVSRTALEEALARSPRRHGAKALRTLLGREAPPARTRSDVERRMLTLVRRHGLPEPRANVQLEEWNVDFLWADQGLVVETDTYSFHSSPAAWERDHRKETALEDAGWRVRRVTGTQLEKEPDRVADRLKRWLA